MKVGNGMLDVCNVKVGVHQVTVLSPLWFAIVMDVCSDIMEGLLPEILYAVNLALMADSMK